MNDPSQMMNQSQAMKNQNQNQMMNQSHMLSMNQQQMLNHPQQQRIIPQMPQSMNQSQPQMVMNQSQPQMLNRGYGMWPPAEQLKYQNPMNFPGFVSSSKPLGRGGNWKGKKGNDKRRIDKSVMTSSNSGNGGGNGGGGGYKPPTLHELQQQNRLKARRYFPKKKFNNRSAPFAPRNTTSFIIRAKKSGGIASLVSPCPVTPAVLPTPIFSPSREALVDSAKEEWGVDGYGSMKGLIRLRSPGNDLDVHEDEEEDDGGSSESDVEEHLEVERRLDHDLSRFEMIYPNYGVEYNNVLENRVDDQDTHIAQVEEENLILKERLFLMEREMADLRRRLISLERQSQTAEEINEEVVENESDNGSESRGYSLFVEDNNDEVVEENNEGPSMEAKEEDNVVNVVQEDKEVQSVVAKEEIVIEENNEVKKVNDDVNVVQEDREVRSVVAKEEIMVEDNTVPMSMQAKKENNDVNVIEGNKAGQSLEVNEDIMEEESKEEQTLEANVKNNLENDLETGKGKSVAAKDVCMEDCDHAENIKKDEGEGTIHESMEKSISGGDLPKSPAAM